MTTAPFGDCVAIDTNVWVHLLNPQDNVNSHIDRLLDYIRQQGIALIVDDQGKIAKEYRNSVFPRYQGMDETQNERYVLRYCLSAPRRVVTLNELDDLMKSIEAVIDESNKDADRTFVYVALKIGRVLISNDMGDIVRGRGEAQTWRRDRLLHDTEGLRPEGADIHTSQEAHGMI